MSLSLHFTALIIRHEAGKERQECLTGLQGSDGTELMPLFTGVESITTARVVAAEEMLVAVGSKIFNLSPNFAT